MSYVFGRSESNQMMHAAFFFSSLGESSDMRAAIVLYLRSTHSHFKIVTSAKIWLTQCLTLSRQVTNTESVRYEEILMMFVMLTSLPVVHKVEKPLP